MQSAKSHVMALRIGFTAPSGPDYRAFVLIESSLAALLDPIKIIDGHAVLEILLTDSPSSYMPPFLTQ